MNFRNRGREKQQPARKLVIHPFNVKPTIPENFEETRWEKLRGAIHDITEKRAGSFSKEELYKGVQDLCILRKESVLFEKLKPECEHFVERIQRDVYLHKQDPDFINYLDTTWITFLQQLQTIRSIFLYLDQTYVRKSTEHRSLWDYGLDLFRRIVMGNDEIHQETVDGILRLIENDRNGELVNHSLIRGITRMLHDLGMYSEEFEASLFIETSKYYSEEGNRYISEMEVPDYLLHTEKRLNEEGFRVSEYMDPITRKELISCVEENLVVCHVDQLLEKGFDQLMSTSRVEDLNRMFVLFRRVGELDKILSFFSAYVKRHGLTIVMDSEIKKSMVHGLLQFKSKLDDITERAFRKNVSFEQKLRESFEEFLNSTQHKNKIAELVAEYLDQKLRSGNREASENELEDLMNRLIILFRFLDGKDIFAAHYCRKLAKRLLLRKFASEEIEQSMISKLQAECGRGYTSQMEGMIKDITVSRALMGAFKESKDYSLLPSMELSVDVLKPCNWPTLQATTLKLPSQLATCQEIFTNFYRNKHNGRLLSWEYGDSSCILRGHFPKGSKELHVSLYQSVILLLFNNAEHLSLNEIEKETSLERRELKRTLQSLACGKVRVLRKTPHGKEVGDEDMFSINRDFSSPRFRVKINTIQMKETQEEKDVTSEKVMVHRQYQIDAAIVRVMKARKQHRHADLVADVFSQLRFRMKASDLKKRIESLIEREYMERDRNDAELYHYLA